MPGFIVEPTVGHLLKEMSKGCTVDTDRQMRLKSMNQK